MDADNNRLQCPYCESYDVGRLFLASVGVDSCECHDCGVRWDEERGSGRYRGRSRSDSVLSTRHR